MKEELNLSPGQQQQCMEAAAHKYLSTIRLRVQDKPETFAIFLDVMEDYRARSADVHLVIVRVALLLHRYPDLIEGFNAYLPAGYRIELPDPTTIEIATPIGRWIKRVVSNEASYSPLPVVRKSVQRGIARPSPLRVPCAGDATHVQIQGIDTRHPPQREVEELQGVGLYCFATPVRW
ncbi:hypothetical protein C8Q80DRAFT_1162580 [Daedaleopsis nitida]|nr:hypothetical protein C8Q80DRAFT_1162580 [Daedaleopsis nitida]